MICLIAYDIQSIIYNVFVRNQTVRISTYLRISMLLFVSDGLLLTVFSLTRPEFCEAIVSSENITRRNQWKKMENCVSE